MSSSQPRTETERHHCPDCGTTVSATESYIWVPSNAAGGGDWFLSNITCQVDSLHQIPVPPK